jgi:hypothetical protein
MSELETMRRAIQSYANFSTLDLHSSAQIQRDLLAIAGQAHHHRSSLGSDACLVCKRDLRDPVHIREQCPVSPGIRAEDVLPDEPVRELPRIRSKQWAGRCDAVLPDDDLCEDCPPRNYPTDKTRCSSCPRRSSPSARPVMYTRLKDISALLNNLLAEEYLPDHYRATVAVELVSANEALRAADGEAA